MHWHPQALDTPPTIARGSVHSKLLGRAALCSQRAHRLASHCGAGRGRRAALTRSGVDVNIHRIARGSKCASLAGSASTQPFTLTQHQSVAALGARNPGQHSLRRLGPPADCVAVLVHSPLLAGLFGRGRPSAASAAAALGHAHPCRHGRWCSQIIQRLPHTCCCRRCCCRPTAIAAMRPSTPGGTSSCPLALPLLLLDV